MSFEVIQRNVWQHVETGKTQSAFDPPKSFIGWRMVTLGYTVRWTDTRTGAPSYGLPEPYADESDHATVKRLASLYDSEGYPGMMYTGRIVKLEDVKITRPKKKK